MFLHLNRDDHLVQDLPILGHLQKFDKGLMTYKHLHTGNWMLSKWINRGSGIIMELCVLGPEPGLFDRKTYLHAVQSIVDRIPNAEVIRMARSMEGDMTRYQLEMGEQWADQKRFIRRNHPKLSVREAPQFQET